jgi:hypothetical protein
MAMIPNKKLYFDEKFRSMRKFSFPQMYLEEGSPCSRIDMH